MEFFVPPDEADEWYRYWVQARFDWHLDLRRCARAICASASTTPTSSRTTRAATSDIEYLYPDRLVRARGRREPRRLRPDASTPSTRGRSSSASTTDGERYVAARDRAGAVLDRADLRGAARRRVRRGGRRATASGPSSASTRALAPVKAAVLPLIGKDADMVAQGARALRGAAHARTSSSTTTAARSGGATAGRTRSARRARSRSTSRRSRTTR